MVVEITGARLLAPTFGVSTIPWTGVIAAVLLGVALGNAWGGRRAAARRALPALLLGAGLLVLLPLARGGLPDVLLDRFGMEAGALAASLVLFLPASFALGAAAPLLVSLGTRSLEEVGRKTGLLNGANALGAIAGTLAAGFVLIPLAPIPWILGLAGAGLCLLAVPAALVARRLEVSGASAAAEGSAASAASLSPGTEVAGRTVAGAPAPTAPEVPGATGRFSRTADPGRRPAGTPEPVIPLDARSAAVAAALLAFGSGFGILVLEIAGGRLLAGTYGLSSVPWTAVIAAVLAGLALGNTVGGWLADRERASLFALFLLAAGTVAVPILGSGLPGWFLERNGFLGGALLTAASYFLLPSVLMGAVTPVLVRSTTREVAEVGRRFGDVGAWSTAGAIVGTVGAGFVLLPAFPLVGVLAAVGAAFLLFAALGAALEGARPGLRAGAALLLVPVLFLLTRMTEPPEGLVHGGQSVHASVQVIDREWSEGYVVRELWQNGSRSSAEARATGQPAHRYQIAAAWLLAERLAAIDSVLVLGGAANSLPTYLKNREPSLGITVVEIDPYVVALAREYFAYGRLEPDALDMRIADARPFLRRDRGRYDVIVADAYDHLYSIPWPLITVEAFEGMAERLRPGGIVIVTLSTPVEGRAGVLMRRIVATIGEVFPHLRAYLSQPGMDLAYTQEVLVVAARDPGDLPRIEWPQVEVTAAGAPFRDDFAPVEYLSALRLIYDPGW